MKNLNIMMSVKINFFTFLLFLVTWKEALEIHEKALNDDDMDFGDILGGGLNFGSGAKKGKKGKGKGDADMFGNLESMMFDMMGGDLNMNDLLFAGAGGSKKKKGKRKKK